MGTWRSSTSLAQFSRMRANSALDALYATISCMFILIDAANAAEDSAPRGTLVLAELTDPLLGYETVTSVSMYGMVS